MTNDKDAYMVVGKTWERTSALRILMTAFGIGNGKLQQGWFCRETGEIEWRDIEIVYDAPTGIPT